VIARACALAALTLALLPGAALADGDPASDVLPVQDAYFPYSPPVSKPLVTALDNLLKEVKAKGYPMKVALLQSTGDMGSYPTLFNNPQRYADLLSSELPSQSDTKYTGPLHLLVVMPGGFGGENLGDKVNQALGPITIDAAQQSDGLARAALQAVARIATFAGHPTKAPNVAATAGSKSSGGGGGGGPSALVIVLPLIGLLIAGGIAGVILRRRSDGRPETRD
jgi:hypothetical protein